VLRVELVKFDKHESGSQCCGKVVEDVYLLGYNAEENSGHIYSSVNKGGKTK